MRPSESFLFLAYVVAVLSLSCIISESFIYHYTYNCRISTNGKMRTEHRRMPCFHCLSPEVSTREIIHRKIVNNGVIISEMALLVLTAKIARADTSSGEYQDYCSSANYILINHNQLS